MVGLDLQRRRLYVSDGESYELPSVPSDAVERAFVFDRENEGVSRFQIYSDPEYPIAKYDNVLHTLLSQIAGIAEPDNRYFYLDEELNVWAPKENPTENYYQTFNLAGIVWKSNVYADPDVPVSVEFSQNTYGPRISLNGGSCECSRVVDESEGILVDHNLGPGDKKLIILGALAYNHEKVQA